MQTSTPRKQADVLRRRSLLNSSVVSSPLRAQIMGPPSGPVVIVERMDDEQERSHRRSLVAMQKKLGNIAPPTPTFAEITKLTEEGQINDHLRICNKLYSDNKISAKNAWELHIIDIIKKISVGSDNVLQIAGSSLDVGAKVYCFRVDDVHGSGLKMASNMARPQENRDNDEVNENAPGEGEVVRKKTQRKRKKRMAGDKKCTIDEGKKNLLAPIKILEPPLFQTKESIEVGATDNLFMYKLRTDPAAHRLTLMSSKRSWYNDPDEILERATKIVDVQMELPKLKDYTILQAFKDFVITDWDPEEEENLLGKPPALDDVVLDAQGLPIAELDGSIHDIFADDNVHDDPMSDIEEQTEDVFHAQIYGGIEQIVDAIPENHRVETDYGFNSTVRTTSGKLVYKLWAGPSHWKVKFNRRSNARFSGTSEQQTVKHTKKAKAPEPIDFTKEPIDFCAVYGKFVNRRAPATTTLEKILLPSVSLDDYNRTITHYLCKPNVPKPKRRLYNPAITNTEDCEVKVYNYDNPNDSQYCSQQNTDDGHDNEPFHNSFDEEEGPIAAQQNFLDENLVDAPALVSTQHVLYALQAKKMDMKKLKAAVWNGLTKDKATDKIEATQFSTLYKELPTRLPADMKKELSCPLAFVALLHLCNENELKLHQENRKDFTITKAVQNL